MNKRLMMSTTTINETNYPSLQDQQAHAGACKWIGRQSKRRNDDDHTWERSAISCFSSLPFCSSGLMSHSAQI